MEAKLKAFLDKAEIVEVVQTERASRDAADWATMLTTWHEDSVVDISWFHGSGPGFVAASRQLYEQGRHSAHQMGPTIVRLNGERALAQTHCAVCVRTLLGGVEVEMIAHSRLHERLEKRDGAWRLSRMGIVYVRDQITLVNPADRIEIDSAQLARFRPSYRFLSYVLASVGQTPRMDLPGVDKPDTVQPLIDLDGEWLASTN